MILRDKHLMPGGPKRVLSLDGGGVRGLITLGILQNVEKALATCHRPDDPAKFRLAHYFDLIGGTSTGSIIAAMLALGKTVEEVRDSYLAFAPKIFHNSDRMGIFKPKFDENGINEQLRNQFGDLVLDSPELITGFAVCAKRIDTGSPVVLFNHPESKYWVHGNAKAYYLRDLLRASAAAPYFFSPHRFVDPHSHDNHRYSTQGIWVDGGVAGLNNPCVEFLSLVAQKDYPFHWNSGEANLFMLSIGTGWFRERQNSKTFMRHSNAWKSTVAMTSILPNLTLLAIKTMQMLGVPPQRNPEFNFAIDSEIGKMPSMAIADPPLLTFRRLDVRLEISNVEAFLNGPLPEKRKLKQRDVAKILDDLTQIDNAKADNMKRLFEIGLHSSDAIANENVTETLDVVR